jgi:hypothetical protein
MTRPMTRNAAIALAAGAALSTIATLSTIDVASAQGLVRPGWTPSGSAVCPRNYDYFQGWCRPVYGGGYGYRREGYPRRGGYGNTVPARWNHLGSAVCPTNYDYVAGIRACVSRY